MSAGITRYKGNGMIEWELDIDGAEFYIGLLDDYLRHHKDAGVLDDRTALLEAVVAAKFIEDDEESHD